MRDEHQRPAQVTAEESCAIFDDGADNATGCVEGGEGVGEGLVELAQVVGREGVARMLRKDSTQCTQCRGASCNIAVI